jgi:hypothetical protein
MGKGVRDPRVDDGRLRGGPPAGKPGRQDARPWLLVAALAFFLIVLLGVLRMATVSTPLETAIPITLMLQPENMTPIAMISVTSPTGTPTSPQGEAPGTATPSPTVLVETSEGTEISDISTLGEVNIEYPIRMTAGSSDVVVLSVYVPAMLASLEPLEVERVEIPPDAPVVAGELNRYRATILVASTMRIELHSLGFAIEDLYPATQTIDIDEVNKATVWAWNVQAPEHPGSYVLVVTASRIGKGDEARPSWIRSLAVEVAGPGGTPGVPGLGWIVGAVALGNVLVAGALVLVLRRRRRLLPFRHPSCDLAVLRELLVAAFGPDELRRLCQSHPALRPVLNDVDATPSLNEVVDAVVDHVERHDLCNVLLELVRQKNPRQYTRFAPRLRIRPG